MNKIPEEIFKGIVWLSHNTGIGGQSCVKINSKVTLQHLDCDFIVSCNAFRSQLKNKEWCMMVFEIYLKDSKIID